MRIDRTRDERAKRLRARKLAAGMASRTVYLPTDTLESLRQAHPGPAGGIEWARVADAAMRPQGSPELPADALAALQAAFPHQGEGGGIDWGRVAGAAMATARKRVADAERIRGKRAAGLMNDTTTNERSRRYRARAKTAGKIIDPTGNDRARRYREDHRKELAERERQRRAKRKAEREAAATAT